MPEVITGARSETLTTDQRASLRYAMLSVYYRSLGSQLESRGAPVIVVPPEVRPLTLEEALDRVKELPDRVWDAYWRIVRAVPVDGWRERPLESRYPRALVELRGRDEIEALDEHRRRSRAGAQVFAAALLACGEGRWDEAEALAALLTRQAGGDFAEAQQFTETSKGALGQPAHEFLVQWLMTPDRKERTREELRKLQDEVGLNLYDFVEDFADVVAFADFRDKLGAPKNTLISSCIVRQDTNTLTTTATVTTLVESDFGALARAIDPLGWPKCSDVIEKTEYLDDPFDLKSGLGERPLGKGFDERQFLFEQVGINWGNDVGQTGAFRNVLAIDKFSVSRSRGTITLPFRLCRSIDSRILWDQRAGGILVDGGYLVARPVGRNRWRLTTRKVLRFSDRTPYSNAPGWRDFGQMLNYLAPASVAYWLETEIYSADCADYRNSPPRRRGAQQTEGRS
jgi:hypothetical protein